MEHGDGIGTFTSGNPARRGLHFQQAFAHGVHRDAVVRAIHGREQRDDFELAALRAPCAAPTRCLCRCSRRATPLASEFRLLLAMLNLNVTTRENEPNSQNEERNTAGRADCAA